MFGTFAGKPRKMRILLAPISYPIYRLDPIRLFRIFCGNTLSIPSSSCKAFLGLSPGDMKTLNCNLRRLTDTPDARSRRFSSGGLLRHPSGLSRSLCLRSHGRVSALGFVRRCLGWRTELHAGSSEAREWLCLKLSRHTIWKALPKRHGTLLLVRVHLPSPNHASSLWTSLLDGYQQRGVFNRNHIPSLWSFGMDEPPPRVLTASQSLSVFVCSETN